mgnify:FL=1
MDRRSFFKKAVASTTTLGGGTFHLNSVLSQLELLNTKIDTCTRSTHETIKQAMAQSCEVIKGFSADMDRLTGRMKKLEAQQFVFMIWLALLSLISGIDFITSIAPLVIVA